MTSVKCALSVMLIIFMLFSASVFCVNTAYAEGESADPEISKKLDDILANQQAILGELAAIKEELNIVKIRVTQQQ